MFVPSISRSILRFSTIAGFALLVTTTLLAARDEPKKGKATLADLSWFAGHWRSDDKGRIVEEVWLPSRGATLIGMNRTTAGKAGEFEFLRIDQRNDQIEYLASPGGKSPPTAFRLKSLEGKVVEFENPENDFPKRIRYERKGDTMIASIHGDGDQSMAWTWKLVNSLD